MQSNLNDTFPWHIKNKEHSKKMLFNFSLYLYLIDNDQRKNVMFSWHKKKIENALK